MNLYLPKVSKPFRWKKPPKEPEFAYHCITPPSVEFIMTMQQVTEFAERYYLVGIPVPSQKLGLGLGATLKDG